jgi:LacI family transcriptional regulator
MSEPRGTRRQRNAPTISDVAARAGVSPMTVSRVINGESNVRERRARASRRRSRRSTMPRAAPRARSQAAKRSASACCTPNPSFNYLSQLLVGSLDQASRLNVQLIVEKCDDEAEERSAVEHLIRARLDGIILTPPLSESLPVLEAIHQRNIPVVAVATGRAPDWALSVSINDHAAAHEMTRHLASLGHRRIGFIKGNPRQTASDERLEGYRKR